MHSLVGTIVAMLGTGMTTTAMAAALVGEDQPWQIHNLSINALPMNATTGNLTQHITFTAIDVNLEGGLNFTTNCSSYMPVGQSLISNRYTVCDFEDAGFSLREEGVLWFHRRYANGEPPPFEHTTCTGNGDLKNATYYSNGPEGMIVVDDYLEIACTQMSS